MEEASLLKLRALVMRLVYSLSLNNSHEDPECLLSMALGFTMTPSNLWDNLDFGA